MVVIMMNIMGKLARTKMKNKKEELKIKSSTKVEKMKSTKVETRMKINVTKVFLV